MALFRGLNIAKSLIDVDDPVTALSNLGLNREDFDLIRGITGAGTDVSVTDFHAMAGLNVDQSSELSSLMGAADRTAVVLNDIDDIKVPMRFNLKINNQFSGGAIKFTYTDRLTGDSSTDQTIKQADISTSRISSWSPIGAAPNEDSHILYGAELKVTGDYLSFTSLETLQAPQLKQFRAEVPTHILDLDIVTGDSGGNPVIDTTGLGKVLVMKGIPLKFDAFFRDADLKCFIKNSLIAKDSQGNVPITWRISNKDGSLITGLPSINSGDGTVTNPGSLGTGESLTSPSLYLFRDTKTKPRLVELFYNPDAIQLVEMKYMNLLEWTNVSLPTLTNLNLEGNDLSSMPEFRNDCTVAVNGFSGGRGLATALEELNLTGNLLSRAPNLFVGDVQYATDDLANRAGSASGQLNRLPTTMRKLTINGCFDTDSDPSPGSQSIIDLSNYTSLTNFSFDSYYQSNQRRIFDSKYAPRVYEPATRVQFTTANIITASKKIDNITELLPGKFSTGDYVKYTLLPINNGNNSGDRNLPSPAITNLTAGTVYQIEVDGTAIYFYASGADLTNSGNRISISQTGDTSSGLTGTYLLEKTNSSGVVTYDDSGGIEYYNIGHQAKMKFLPSGVYESSRLVFLDITNCTIKGNGEYRDFETTGSASGATTAQGSANRAIPAFRSNQIVEFLSSGYNNRHNIIDMSNKTTLQKYHHFDVRMDTKYKTSERTSDGKFDNCPSLKELKLRNIGWNAGKWKTSGIFQNKPELTLADVRWGWAGRNGEVDGGLSDSMFTGSDNIDQFFTGGSAYGRNSNDFFATSGSTNSTGQAFARLSKARWFYHVHHPFSGGRLVNAENPEYSLKLSNCINLRRLYIHRCNARGTFPDLNANVEMRYFDIRFNSHRVEGRWGQPDTIYKIESNHSNDTQAVWEQAGWTANANRETIYPGETGTNGSSPAVGDSFIAQFVEPATTTLNAGKYYTLRELPGTVTLTDWNNIDYYTRNQAYFDANIKPGHVFRASGNAPGGTVVSAGSNLKVFPRLYSKIRSSGFTGNFPTLTLPKLWGCRLALNSFTGQFPKLDMNNCHWIWADNNRFSGSIPDFSGMTNKLYKVKFQNNRLSTYQAGNLKDNLKMRDFNFSSNRLTANIATVLIHDLYQNYVAKPRSGVTLNFLGQTPDNGQAAFNLAAIEGDGTGDITNEDSSIWKLNSLRSNGWTILLD